MVTALYRRYRPEAFSEMIGQAQVTEPLMTALRTGRIGHAYLFSGPRGCGKTTSARILARCLNCAEGPTDTPCGVCPSCVELSRDGGGSLDVVEIDAASHGGVDDARDLRERAVFAPARDRYKIFIIDEAHMVTAGGFNALLKIVEEPPPHVKFVFATTEPEKVIGTIRSRTHHYPFRLIAPGALIDYVQGLCDSEGIGVEPGVLPLVVRAGGGSARDTLSILDQLIAGSEEGRVTLDRATGLLGFTSTELLDDAVTALGAHDSAAAFRASDRVVQTGQDPRRFVEDLLERLRDLIVIGATSVQGASAVFRGVPDDQLQRMFEQSQIFAPGELSRMADTVSGALDKMAGATAPRLQLELMIARALAAAPTPAGAGAPAVPPRAAQSAAPASAGRAGAPAGAPMPAATPPPAATPAPAAAAVPAAAPAVEAATPAPAVDPETRPAAAWAEAAATAETAPNAAEAVRAAREFLRTDSAGAAPFGRPVTDVLAGVPREPLTAEALPPQQAPAEPTPPAAQPDAAAEAARSAPAPASETGAGDGTASAAPDLDDLMEVWPDLLEEILQRDRDAWNAVRGITPMGLDGELLTVGLASESDLAAFKTAGAGPLRETILDALGVNVKYRPKRIAPGQASGQNGQQGAGREPGDEAGQREMPSSDAEEPHRGDSFGAGGPRRGDSLGAGEPRRGGSPVASEPVDPLEAKLRARLGSVALTPKQEPVTAAEAVASVVPVPAAPASAPAAAPEAARPPSVPQAPEAVRAADPRPAPQQDTWQDDEPSDDPDGDPWAEAGGDPFQESVAPPRVSAAAPHTETPVAAAPAAQAAPASRQSVPEEQAWPAPADPAPAVAQSKDEQVRGGGPKFTRYGEAVVREVLGARFIEERPLPVERGYETGEGERA